MASLGVLRQHRRPSLHAVAHGHPDRRSGRGRHEHIHARAEPDHAHPGALQGASASRAVGHDTPRDQPRDLAHEERAARAAQPDRRLLVIDEILTPDSSRFWPADRYAPGRSQPSFDKQPLRDYLAGLKQEGQWDGNAPAPPLPREVVQATSERYLKAYQLITGRSLE